MRELNMDMEELLVALFILSRRHDNPTERVRFHKLWLKARKAQNRYDQQLDACAEQIAGPQALDDDWLEQLSQRVEDDALLRGIQADTE